MDRKNSEEGLSEVIGFILILALIMVFLSIWVIYAVPADGRQQEIEHMDYVQDWFTQYKITADSLWINYNATDQTGPSGITISNSLVLGSQGGATYSQGLFMIFMRPFGSSGTLSIENRSEKIEIRNDSMTLLDEEMMCVQYDGSNTYWIPQTYYYQMGGVFLEQSDGTVNRVAPLVYFYSFDGLDVARFVITNITLGQTETTSISGEGPVRIDTVLTDKTELQPAPEGEGYTINMTLRDDSAAKAWMSILNELGAPDVDRVNNELTISGIDEIQYQYVNYTVSLQSVAASFN